MPFAHVCFESLESGTQHHGITDENGLAENIAVDRSIVAVSFVGFETLYDTIVPAKSKILALKPTIVNINEVVVTAQYAPQRVDKSIYKIKVLGAQQIDKKGANNLNELFANELNIRVQQTGVLGAKMSIRGLGGEHVKFLIDGVPVIGRLDGNIDLGQLNLSNVDHVEVIEGPMSVIYGSNALGGIVNIITKENRNTRFGANVEGYVESVGVYNFNGSAYARKKNNIISISGGRNFFGGYSDPDTSRAQQWKPKEQYFVDGYYIYDQKNYKIKYSSQFFNEKLKNNGPLRYPYNETAIDNEFITRRFTNSLDYNTKIGKYRYVQVLGAFAMYDRYRRDYYNDLVNLQKYLQYADTTKFQDATLRSVISKSDEGSKVNYQLGIDFHYEHGSGVKIEDGSQSIGDYAAFLSIKYEPLKILQFQPGIRYIYNTRYEAPLVYSLNIKWLPHELMNVRASYSRGFRAPSLKELYLDFEDINHNVKGNPNLKAENSHNFNLVYGYSHELNKDIYSFDIDLFYNKINDLIKLVPILGINEKVPPYTYTNIGNYISQGFQVDVSYTVYPRIKIQAGVVETGRKYNNIADSVQFEPEMLYSTDVNATVTYSILKADMDFNLFYKYNGKYPDYGINAETGEWVKGYIEPFNTMDFSVMKSFVNRSLQLTAGVKNMFNNTSIRGVGSGGGSAHSGGAGTNFLIGWGRTVFLKVSYSFNKF
ncbi:MAG: TonB-dependent receptor [Bacteroidales bacterium]